jgi:hypothetical protein
MIRERHVRRKYFRKRRGKGQRQSKEYAELMIVLDHILNQGGGGATAAIYCNLRVSYGNILSAMTLWLPLGPNDPRRPLTGSCHHIADVADNIALGIVIKDDLAAIDLHG